MRNPFANPNHPLDYDLLAKDVVIRQKMKLPDGISQTDIANLILDASNGATYTQTEWIDYFNKERKVMIGAPYLYALAKSALKRNKDAEKKLARLQNDFNDSNLICSDHVMYDDPNGKGGVIFHSYKNKIIPTYAASMLIPVMRDEPLPFVLNVNDMNTYAKSLFDARKDTDTMFMSVLEILSGERAKDILFTTPNDIQRKESPEVSIALGNKIGGFNIFGHIPGIIGRSRGLEVQIK